MLHGGVSMDQVLAAHFGEETAQPSLVLGCEQPITGYHETNFSMAYSSHISWQDANSPVPMEVYPSLAFDSLFDNQGSRRTLSILDRVKEQAADLNRQVSRADQAKLDEYLTSVREVEKRVERTRADKDRADDKARDRGRPAIAMPRPDNGLPEDIREHMRLMCDIIALAFQTDKTRVATLLLCRDLSGLFYPFLDVRTAHHPTSHDDNSDAYERVTRYYVSQLAYLAGRLAAMPEGDATVLDNSCLMFVSNMWSGSRHDSSKVPVLLVGGLGGTLATGRVLDYTGPRRRQPQAVQPVPVADEPHGGEGRPLRRRHGAARWVVSRQRFRSPSEEAIRVVPFLRRVEVKAVQPALFAPGRLHGGAKTGQDRRGPGRPQVRRQARHQARTAPERPLEVHLLFRVELPRNELAEDDVGVFGLRQDAVADRCRPRR